MSQSSSTWIKVGLSVNAALLCAVLAALLSRSDAPPILPAALAQQPVAGGAGLYLMPGQLSPNTWGCYIMDVDRQTLMVYAFAPGERQLRFLAAREMTHDRAITNYNTEPAPAEIQSLIQKERDNARVRP